MTELKNLKITHVSYVRKGANKKQFFLMKSDEDTNFEKDIRLFINKSDEEQKLIYGIVYEPDEIDTHGEFAKASEIEKAAHEFLADNRNIDLQHNFESDYGTVVESYIAPVDFKIANDTVKKGAWVLVTKANDDIWKAVKKGEITGYSMAGKANKIIIDDNNIEKTFNISNDDDVRGFFNVIKDFFSKAHKLSSEKEKNNKENEEMEKEDIQNIIKNLIDDALKPIYEKLKSLERQDTIDTPTTDNTLNKEEINKMFTDVIAKAVKPINQRLEEVEKAKGISKQQQQNIFKETRKSIFSDIQI